MRKTRNSIGGWLGFAAILFCAIFAGSAQQMKAFESANNGHPADRTAALLAFAAAPPQQEAESEHATAEHGAAGAAEHGPMEKNFPLF